MRNTVCSERITPTIVKQTGSSLEQDIHKEETIRRDNNGMLPSIREVRRRLQALYVQRHEEVEISFLQYMQDALKNRLKIQKEIKDFQQIVALEFDALDRKYIEEALELMLLVHGTQQDRPDGQPYIIHPLQVADDLLQVFGVRDRDMIIAGLLHDTVEDQPAALITYWEQKQGLSIAEEAKTERLQATTAFSIIHSFFGTRVRDLVYALTNPEMLPTATMTKEAIYAAHIAEIVQDPSVATIKFADFHRNALTVREITNPDIQERARQKYGPVLRTIFIPLFEELTETHPLWNSRAEMLAKMYVARDSLYAA